MIPSFPENLGRMRCPSVSSIFNLASFATGGKPSCGHRKDSSFSSEKSHGKSQRIHVLRIFSIPTFGIYQYISCYWIVHGSEGSSRQGREETCVCLKRTQRNRLKRSTQTTCLSLVGGSDTTTHHIFRICPAPLAMHGCLRSRIRLPKTNAKNKCKNTASKRTALQHALFFWT